MKKFLAFIALPALLLAATQYFEPVQIKFDNRLYSLAYSAKPVPNLFTQEYLLPGEKLDSFSYMLSLNTLKFDATPEQAVEQKINDLKELKTKGLKVAYKKGSLANEIYLDITIFSNLNGVPTAEHSIYRYTKQGGNLVLFTIQRRAYKKEGIQRFATNFTIESQDFSKKALATPFPQIINR
ncbi:hypothetical protein [Campylobacter concisus]|uniref:hypothetical protein n=1 Tax=Campylobacter concisus TaxID=199 RepID=UPI000CD890E7|nr:hypothetical protein [Campylobacter concisus]